MRALRPKMPQIGTGPNELPLCRGFGPERTSCPRSIKLRLLHALMSDGPDVGRHRAEVLLRQRDTAHRRHGAGMLLRLGHAVGDGIGDACEAAVAPQPLAADVRSGPTGVPMPSAPWQPAHVAPATSPLKIFSAERRPVACVAPDGRDDASRRHPDECPQAGAPRARPRHAWPKPAPPRCPWRPDRPHRLCARCGRPCRRSRRARRQGRPPNPTADAWRGRAPCARPANHRRRRRSRRRACRRPAAGTRRCSRPAARARGSTSRGRR